MQLILTANKIANSIVHRHSVINCNSFIANVICYITIPSLNKVLYLVSCILYSQCYFILDHIFLSESLSHYIVNYYSKCDEGENQSDHAPIVFRVRYTH